MNYHILTLGCQMNKNDSERMEGILRNMGLAPTDVMETADVIMVNTCSVRESAENRIFGHAKTFLELKEKNPRLVVGITGCMAGRDKDGALRSRLKGVDLFFPTRDMVQLPFWLSQLLPELRNDLDVGRDYLALRPVYNNTVQAFVTIQTGCNQFCTYCVVPYARGLEKNRPVKDILEEVKNLAASGCLEITLLGQIVNHYVAPDPENFSPRNMYQKNHFAKLLWEINQIADIERIHWTAPHPLHMDDEVIDALNLPKQLNYIHLPSQSGSTEVLKRMNRKHTREHYLEVIKKIRAKRPQIAIGTDIIVGFSGETEEQFEETLSMYTECDFDIAYPAQYSVRSGTLAVKLYNDDVPKEVKKDRWERLQKLMEDRTYEKNQVYLGRDTSVLIDTWRDGWCEGNSREMKRVRIKGTSELVGKILKGKIFKTDTWMMWAE